MSQTVRITYCGMDGSGRSITEARKDAAAKLAQLVEDLQRGPVIVRFGTQAKLVHRNAWSWEHTLITDEQGQLNPPIGGGTAGCQTRAEAIVAAARHCADLAWTLHVNDDRAFARAALEPYVATRDLPRMVDDLVERWQFRRRYDVARAQEYDDTDARHIAGGLGHLVQNRKPTPAAGGDAGS